MINSQGKKWEELTPEEQAHYNNFAASLTSEESKKLKKIKYFLDMGLLKAKDGKIHISGEEAVYFQTTHGLPIEMFKMAVNKLINS